MIWTNATCQAKFINDGGQAVRQLDASSRIFTHLVFWPEDIEYYDRDSLIDFFFLMSGALGA